MHSDTTTLRRHDAAPPPDAPIPPARWSIRQVRALVRRVAAVGLPGLLVAIAVGCSDPATSPPLASGDAAAGASSGPVGAPAVVVRVIDGDTVVVALDGTRESVRLIGVDTPEPRGSLRPAECFGDEASAFTASLLPEGTPVLLTRDTEIRDRYDRLLGYLYRADDGLFVNLTLVEHGYADVLTIAPNDTYAATFTTAASRARAAGLGLWGTCGGPDTVLDR